MAIYLLKVIIVIDGNYILSIYSFTYLSPFYSIPYCLTLISVFQICFCDVDISTSYLFVAMVIVDVQPTRPVSPPQLRNQRRLPRTDVLPPIPQSPPRAQSPPPRLVQPTPMYNHRPASPVSFITSLTDMG